ncbi:hypothetical protein GW17_00029948, partial [Ensete ventricosum]
STASATLSTVDRALGRSRVGDSRIKQRPHAGLPRTADRSRINWRPRAEKAAQSGGLELQRPTTHSRALAAV